MALFLSCCFTGKRSADKSRHFVNKNYVSIDYICSKVCNITAENSELLQLLLQDVATRVVADSYYELELRSYER